MKQEKYYPAWCRGLIDSMKESGVWCVPRSGLIFQKTGPHALMLIDRMPHVAEMPISAEKLGEFQESDFNVIRQQFALAGVSVTRKEKT